MAQHLQLKAASNFCHAIIVKKRGVLGGIEQVMKYELPDNHGLSDAIQRDRRLVPSEDGAAPSFTDIQYDALAAGVARGQSLLAVAPTSTGKTLVGLWALASGLERGQKAIYLVTLRALAKQKFDEVLALLLESHLGGMRHTIVLATGDGIVDGEGNSPSDPLGASVIVATYEKFLAMVSSSGVEAAVYDRVFVCDEIQLIGDEHRGRSVEVLLTLMANGTWSQLVGLSAVIEQRDAEAISDWLHVNLVKTTSREKRLVYECWTPRGKYISDTNADLEDPVYVDEPLHSVSTLAIVHKLLENDAHVPIIVFCMHKPETYDLSSRFFLAMNDAQNDSPPIFDFPPETETEQLLSQYIPARIAFHSADQ